MYAVSHIYIYIYNNGLIFLPTCIRNIKVITLAILYKTMFTYIDFRSDISFNTKQLDTFSSYINVCVLYGQFPLSPCMDTYI